MSDFYFEIDESAVATIIAVAVESCIKQDGAVVTAIINYADASHRQIRRPFARPLQLSTHDTVSH